jgi:hypothetical protein
MAGMYDVRVYRWVISDCMIYIRLFMKIGSGIQDNLRGCNVGITEGRGIAKYVVQMVPDGMIYIPNFMKIGTDIQAIIRFCFRSLRGCNVGIIDWRDL